MKMGGSSPEFGKTKRKGGKEGKEHVGREGGPVSGEGVVPGETRMETLENLGSITEVQQQHSSSE